MNIRIRLATPADIPVLRALIEASVRGLQAGDYTPTQIEGALDTVYGVDTQLITDGTYFVAEAGLAGSVSALSARPSAQSARSAIDSTVPTIVGCGGWSKRKTLFGGDRWTARQDDLLNPQRDAAKIRAFFVHPAWARRGIGSMILEACENAARSAGFTRLEMGATLTGVPFYAAKGYVPMEHVEVPLSNGASLPIVRMTKGRR